MRGCFSAAHPVFVSELGDGRLEFRSGKPAIILRANGKIMTFKKLSQAVAVACLAAAPFSGLQAEPIPL